MDDVSKYVVSSTPHIRDNISTQKIMLDVIIALTPAALMGIYFFGIDAFTTIFVSIASCVFFEYFFRKLRKQQSSVHDLSAVVTGLLLAMNLPASNNTAIPIMGGFIAIVLVKQIFGGIGHNFLNPALTARAFLLLSYPTSLVTFRHPSRNFFGLGTSAVDAVATATPLALLGDGLTPAAHDYVNALIGYHSASLGEGSAIALLIGGLYLLIKRIINWRIPVTFMLSTMLLTWVIGRGDGMFSGYPIYEVLAGGLLLGAFFMATDYTTSPVTPLGQIIMGVGCGILTALIRLGGVYPEGVSFAIMFMNLATPLIDKFTPPTVFGRKQEKPRTVFDWGVFDRW